MTPETQGIDDTTSPVKVGRALARRFIERSEVLDYKGKRRDSAALDYFIGAASALELAGHHEVANHIKMVSVLVIAVRGYFGVKEIASKD